MQGENSDITAWIAKHPRMMGVLFVLMMLLTQVGTVAAGNGGTIVGP